MAELLVYGAYGYTGSLVAEAATERGLDPLLAGRDGAELADLATTLDCRSRAFDLSGDVAGALEGVDVVLNCAGPFVDTYEPLVRACLETGTDYLDVTGELDVFQGIAAHDDEAAAAGVTLLPGVGFDVVPTDCLAAHLADRLPGATHLALGFDASVGISPGTAKTVLRYLDEPGFVRREGLLEPVPPAYRTRRIDFGRGRRTAATVPWGDLVTAYHTTGIPNVETYAALPLPAVWTMRATRPLAPLFGTGPVRSALEAVVDATVDGPGERTRERGRSYVWGEATTEGDRVVSRLEIPETYTTTVRTALAVAERVLAGEAPTGFQTPAGAFGPDLILSVEGAERFDE